MAGIFGLSTAVNVATPLWENIDEPGHFQYAKFVAENHRLPSKTHELPKLSAEDVNCVNVRCVGRGTVTDQPPLYYVLAALFIGGIDLNEYVSWVPNPFFTWPNHPLRNGIAIQTLTDAWPYRGMVLGAHIIRAVSGLMGAGTLVVIYFAGVSLTRQHAFGLAAAALAGLTPGYLLSTASISNDNAAALTGSLGLLCAVRTLTSKARRWFWLAMYGVALVLGIAAKDSLVFLVPVGFVLVLTLAFGAGEGAWTRVGLVLGSIATGAGAIGIAALVWPTPLRKLMDSLSKVPQVVHTSIANPGCSYRCPLPLQGIWGGVPNMFETYWGSFGWETFHLPPPFYRPFLFFSLLAVVGVAVALVRAGRRTHTPDFHLPAFGVLAAAFVILLLVVVYYDMAGHNDGGTTHGRFLFPALLSSSIFLAAGLWSLPRWGRWWALHGLICTCLAAIGYALWIVPRSFGPVLPVYGDTVSAGVQDPRSVSFEKGIRLRGASYASLVVRPGESMQLILFWDAIHRVDFDYSAFVRLDNGQGTAIHGIDHGLGQPIGLLSHEWQRGEIIPDRWTIAIPAGTPPGEYAVQIGVYDYRDLHPVLDQHGDAAFELARVRIES